MNKIKAYTLIELIIVLIISSILILFSVQIILNISKVYEISIFNIDTQIEFLGLENAISKDLNKSLTDVETKRNEIVFTTITDEVIKYKSHNNRVSRTSSDNKSNTNYHLKEVRFAVEKRPEGLIIRINSNKKAQTVYKTYSSKYLLSNKNYLEK